MMERFYEAVFCCPACRRKMIIRVDRDYEGGLVGEDGKIPGEDMVCFEIKGITAEDLGASPKKA